MINEQFAISDAMEQIKILENKIDFLTNESIHTCHDQCQKIACVQRRKIEELELKLKIAVEALEFYGSNNNWMAIRQESRFLGVIVNDYEFGNHKHGGVKARQALKKLGVSYE